MKRIMLLCLSIVLLAGCTTAPTASPLPPPTQPPAPAATTPATEAPEPTATNPPATQAPEPTALPTLTISVPEFDMVAIPAGEFVMGCDPQHNGGVGCPEDELPLHTVYLDEFFIDKYEVTNIQYAECVAADGCQPPMTSGSELVESYFGSPDYDYYPVVHVTWFDAKDYCTWAGKRLPTEAEWEKAARGSVTSAYPWGEDEPTCTLTNFLPFGTTGLCLGDTSPVGSHPLGVNAYGLEDMAGNVWEWVADWYGETYYLDSPAENPTGPDTDTYRVLRGGGWTSGPIHLRVSSRAYDPDFHNASDVGFRCASDTGE